jgi:hypothetical protein
VDGQETPPAKAEWGWVRQLGALRLGGCLTFVRGARPEQIIEAYGMDPGAARLLPAPVAWEWLLPGGPPWVRAGQAGDWAFAIEEVTQLALARDVARGMSAGTDAAEVIWTAKPTSDVRYLVDRTLVTAFAPGMEWDRSGAEPDRFLGEMSRTGMRLEPPLPRRPARRRDIAEERRRPRRDPLIAALDMLTLALGIRLPEEVARGRLLTAQRALH